MFPGYAAAGSLLWLLVQLLIRLESVNRLYQKLTRSREDLDEEEAEEVEVEDTVALEHEHSSVVTLYAARYGGTVIFAFRVFRLLCTLALLSLSLVTAVLATRSKDVPFTIAVGPHIVLCMSYVSSSCHDAVLSGPMQYLSRAMRLCWAFFLSFRAPTLPNLRPAISLCCWGSHGWSSLTATFGLWPRSRYAQLTGARAAFSGRSIRYSQLQGLRSHCSSPGNTRLLTPSTHGSQFPSRRHVCCP